MSGIYEAAVKGVSILLVPGFMSVGSAAYAALRPVQPVVQTETVAAPPPPPAPPPPVEQLTTWSVITIIEAPPPPPAKKWTCEKKALFVGRLGDIDVRSAQNETVTECALR
jgi:hypothetical protein